MRCLVALNVTHDEVNTMLDIFRTWSGGWTLMSRKSELLLSEDPQSHLRYRRMMEETIDAVLDASCDGSAYGGRTPQQLQAVLQDTLLPSHGMGYEAVLEKMKKEVLPNFVHTYSDRTWRTSTVPR
jgi:hypothetical protein